MYKLFCNNCNRTIRDYDLHFELNIVNEPPTLAGSVYDDVQLCSIECVEQFAAKINNGGR